MPNRQLFVEVLVAEREAFATFLDLLQAESAALLRGDVDALMDLASRKLGVVETLSELGRKRRRQLVDDGFAADSMGMTEWLLVHAGNDHPTLSRVWKDLQTTARAARDLNRSNGVLIESRLRFNQGALTALRAAMQQSTLYGPDGSPDFDGRTSRELGLA
jgi:flagella synthesis protein FlgN